MMIPTIEFTIDLSALADILPLRALFLQENNIQIRYDACHVRNWSTPWLIRLSGEPVGYGAVKGLEALADRDTIFEFYLLPHLRKWSGPVFEQLIRASGAIYIESQTNELQLTALLYEYGRDIFSDTILFSDHHQTNLMLPGVQFRKRRPEDDVFGLAGKDAGDYVLEKEGHIVATGGFLTHYNPPFADLYMETGADFRNQGYSSYLLQEVKKVCYAAGRVPAARCNMHNTASRATLRKAGLEVCGFMLTGTLSGEDT